MADPIATGSVAAGAVAATGTIEAGAPAMAQHHSLWEMISGAGPIVQLVFWGLVLLSVWSWAITIQKILQFRKARQATDAFTNIFWESRNFAKIDDSSRRLDASPLARVFSSGYKELMHLAQEPSRGIEPDLDPVERALKRAEIEEAGRLETGVTFLATVASAAPFIGLFGTVWGIMNAFHGLGDAKSSTLQAVAPGISEALVATAIGLAAAIPAAISYNYFVVAIKRYRVAMQSFCGEFLNIARKSLPR